MELIVEIPKNNFKAIVQYKNQSIYCFRYDLKETTDETIKCKETSFMLKDVTYEKLVSQCILIKYSIDAQIALIYNYQKNPEEYLEEMNKYQSWRNYCKESARNFFS